MKHLLMVRIMNIKDTLKNWLFYFFITFTLFLYRCKTIDVNEIQFNDYYFKDGTYVYNQGHLGKIKEIGYYKQVKNIIYLYPMQFPYPETISIYNMDTNIYYFELINRFETTNLLKFDSILVFEDNLPPATYFPNRFTLKNSNLKNLVIKFYPKGLSKIDNLHIIDLHSLGIDTVTRKKFIIQFYDNDSLQPYMLKIINKNQLRDYTANKTPKRFLHTHSKNVSCPSCKNFIFIGY